MILNIKSVENYRNFEGMFRLNDPEKAHAHAILDCQSFFQKLDFKNSEDSLHQEYYITQSECKYIYDVIQMCLEKQQSKCLDSEDIFNPTCQCQ